MSDEFSIGTEQASLVLLSDEDITAPQHSYRNAAQVFRLGSGLQKDLGKPIVTWSWNALSTEAREFLRAFCPGRSAEVVIRTLDDGLVYYDYSCTMHWPVDERPDAGYILDFTLTFTDLIKL